MLDRTVQIRRRANVVAKTSAVSVVLNITDYFQLLDESNGGGVSVEKRPLLPDALMRSGSSGTKHHHHRRVTIYDGTGKATPERIGNIVRRFTRFCTEAIFINLYWRFYRELKLFPDRAIACGAIAVALMDHKSTKKKTVDELRREVHRALEMAFSDRTPADHALVTGLLNQRNWLKERVCSRWANYEYAELCKRVTFLQVSPFHKVIGLLYDKNCCLLNVSSKRNPILYYLISDMPCNLPF